MESPLPGRYFTSSFSLGLIYTREYYAFKFNFPRYYPYSGLRRIKKSDQGGNIILLNIVWLNVFPRYIERNTELHGFLTTSSDDEELFHIVLHAHSLDRSVCPICYRTKLTLKVGLITLIKKSDQGGNIILLNIV
jgi:hypothetical protein